jgi:hypothetical protein
MTIKQHGGIFGRNPTFNDVDVDGTLNVGGSTSITGTDNDAPLLDLRADNTGGGTKNTLRFYDDDVSASTWQQSGRIEFYTNDNTNSGVNTYIDSETNLSGYGQIKIGTGLAGSATDRLTIASLGDVTVNTGNLVIGTSGKGIDFSATSGTGTSELFDDYEEGTWTPVIQGSSSNPSATYGLQRGVYTKAGRLVHVSCYLSWSGYSGGSGDALIGGLPFTVESGTSAYGGVSISRLDGVTFAASRTFAGLFILSGTTTMRFYSNGSGVNSSTISVSGIGASGLICFSASYQA